ncbi:MAG: M20/M25/M40 family metallo-hydrolase [Promethearchaeota archaeon]
MDEKAKEFLKKCIEIYSPSGEEKEYSEFLADFLKNHDFIVRFDKVGNLIAEKGSGKTKLLLVSHMDTIPGELPVIEKDGKIYGRGAVDCKSSLAAMVYSISQYNFKQENAGKIIFSGIIREEDSLIGIEEFMNSNIQPDYAIFGEPTNINQICIGYKGRICLGFKVLSESGHVASSWLHVNAIEVCLEIWKMIKGACWQLTENYCKKSVKTKYYNQIIPNLTVISGGHLTNCIPSESVIQVDIRFPPSINSEKILSEIRKSILNFKHMYENQVKINFQIQENISSLIEGYEMKGNNLLIGALRWAIFNTIKEKPKIIKKTGTTFINYIGLSYGIPSITYGPGDPKLEHTNNEFIEIDEYLKTIEVYKKFFRKFFELYKKRN